MILFCVLGKLRCKDGCSPCHSGISTIAEWKYTLHLVSPLSWLSGRKSSLCCNLRTQFTLLSKLTDSTKIQKYFTLFEAEFHAVELHVSNYRICINLCPIILDIHWSIYTLLWEVTIRSLRQKLYISILTFKNQS